jgi:O-antigen/teichoic acid export membrane protein
LHEQIFQLFAARKFRGVSGLLPWIVLSGGIFAAAQLVGLNLMSRLQVNAMILCTISTAIAGIVMNFVGAYFFGLSGVVGAGLAFSILYFVWIYLLNRRVARATRAGIVDIVTAA